MRDSLQIRHEIAELRYQQRNLCSDDPVSKAIDQNIIWLQDELLNLKPGIINPSED